MKSAIIYITILLTLLRPIISIGQNSSDLPSRIAYQCALITESKTADDIYIIKSRIDKLSSEARTYSEKKLVRDAFLLLSDKFAFYSHFKSGAFVYFNYLEINEQLHIMEVQLINDSIQSFRNKIANGGNILVDDENLSESSDLNVAPTDSTSELLHSSDSSEGISNIESSTGSNIKWVLGLLCLILLMFFVFMRQRKKIALVKSSLEKEQSDLKHLFRISANVSMLSGAIRYAREFSAHCAAVLIDLVEMTNQNKRDAKVDSSKANQAINVFKRISSGEDRSL